MYPEIPLHENQWLCTTPIELQRDPTAHVIWIRGFNAASAIPPPPRARSPLAGRVRNPAAPKIKRCLFPSRVPSANSGCARVPPTEPAPRRRPQGCARHPPAEPALRRRPQGCARRPPAEPALHRRPVLRAPAASAGMRGPRAPRLPRTRPALQPTLRAPTTAAGTRAGGCGRRPPPPGHAPAAGSASAAIFSGFSEVFLGIFRSSRWRPNPARFVLGNCC